MNKKILEQLEQEIINSYEQGVTMEEAEKLAGKFLGGQIKVSQALREKDLDSRMKKSGLKAVRAAVYTEIKAKGEKQTVDQLEHLLNMDELVSKEQDALDIAEVDRDELKRYYDIFQNAHIHYRTVARGSFGS